MAFEKKINDLKLTVVEKELVLTIEDKQVTAITRLTDGEVLSLIDALQRYMGNKGNNPNSVRFS